MLSQSVKFYYDDFRPTHIHLINNECYSLAGIFSLISRIQHISIYWQNFLSKKFFDKMFWKDGIMKLLEKILGENDENILINKVEFKNGFKISYFYSINRINIWVTEFIGARLYIYIYIYIYIYMLRRPDKYTGPRKLLKYKWLTTNLARMTKQGCCFERPNFIMANRKSGKRTANNRRDRMAIVGTGLDSWYKTGIRWIGGRWCRTGFCWCRKMVAGLGMVSACAGRWSLVLDW